MPELPWARRDSFETAVRHGARELWFAARWARAHRDDVAAWLASSPALTEATDEQTYADAWFWWAFQSFDDALT